MIYQRGDIIWVKFPFSDASSNKLRPALIVSNNLINQTEDYLLMQIATRLRNDIFSLPILNKNFKESPLLKQSELRIHKIFIVNQVLIESKIASVQDSFMQAVIQKLITFLQ